MCPAPTVEASSCKVCSSCGGEIPGKTALGQCPRCLLGLGLTHAEENDHPVAFAKFQADDDFDYDLLECIGRGGMGLVYRARQRSLNRIVAVKVMAAGEFASPAALARFRREAETAAKLDHPNIVAIIEVGEHRSVPFLVMRLVDGESLAARLDELALPKAAPGAARSGDKQAQIAIARMIATVARAVDYAHVHGVLHRDLKPSNILLDAQGNPHLTDFGIAKSVEEEVGLTKTSELLGTVSYMAPEQAAGKKVSRAADVYSLGAILYELLTGRAPFEGPTMEVLRQVLAEDPPQPRALNPAIDRDLATICLKCLDKNSSRRYHSALALAEDLERWQRHEPIHAREAGPVLRLQRWTFRNPALATLLLTLSAGVAVSLVLLARANEEKERKSIALDILRTESARQLQEIWASASSSFQIKSETLAAMSGMELTGLTELEDRFTIGLVSEGNPLARVLRAAPVFHDLEGTLSSGEKPARIDLSLYKVHHGAIEDLIRGRIDFALLNAREFLRARALAPGVRPIVTIQPQEGFNDAAIIFTRRDTGIKNLEGLRGKSLLLGTANSTLCFWTKVSLAGASIKASDLSRYRYIDQPVDLIGGKSPTAGVALGNPYSSMTPVEAVIAGFYDAAVVRERRFREVAAEQDLVALARFEDSGELLVARPNLPAQTAASFQRALLSLTHAVSEGSFFDAPARFKAATEEDYKAIEERLSAEAAFEE